MSTIKGFGMFNGYGSLAAVALQIVRDAAEFDLKSATKYTPSQIVHLVVDRMKSVASCTPYAPSYLWCTVVPSPDMDGDVSFTIDYGKLPKWVSAYHQPARGHTNRINWPANIGSESGEWEVVFGYYEFDEWKRIQKLIESGLSIGQMFLIRATGEAYQSYEGEYNESWDPEIIYARPAPVLWLPLTNPFYKEILPGVSRHEEAWQIGERQQSRITLLSSNHPDDAAGQR